MLGALNSTLALFLLQISLAYALMVFNNKDLSKFESDINAHYSVTTPAIINNFIQVSSSYYCLVRLLMLLLLVNVCSENNLW